MEGKCSYKTPFKMQHLFPSMDNCKVERVLSVENIIFIFQQKNCKLFIYCSTECKNCMCEVVWTTIFTNWIKVKPLSPNLAKTWPPSKNVWLCDFARFGLRNKFEKTQCGVFSFGHMQKKISIDDWLFYCCEGALNLTAGVSRCYHATTVRKQLQRA